MVRGSGTRNEGSGFAYVRPSQFIKVFKAPIATTFDTIVNTPEGKGITVRSDLAFAVSGARGDKLVADFFNTTQDVIEKIPLVGQVLKLAEILGFKVGCLIGWGINSVTQIIANVFEQIKDAKIVGLDISGEKTDKFLDLMIRLITVDFEGAYSIAIVLTVLTLLASLILAFKISPKAIPLIGNLLSIFISVINRVITSIGGLF